MSEESNTARSAPAQIEIVSTRDFSMPRAELFEMFSNPRHLAQWWGPQGFTNTFKVFDFQPGGGWRFTMHGPDGGEYPIENQFEEIVYPERIVVRHFQTDHGFQLTMTFDEHGGGTRLTWRMLFDPGVGNAELKGFIAKANEQNLDRLQAYVASPAAQG